MTLIIKADRSGARIVPAAIQNAHDEAREILTRARAEAEQLREDARDVGRAQGRAELAAEFVHTARARDAQLGALEGQAIELALLAAQRIVGAELSLRPERIAEIVRPLLSRIRRARQVSVRVHPDDRSALAQAHALLAEHAELGCAIAIEEDANLARGGCVVTSDAGILDARLEVRLDAMAAALAKP